MQTTIDLRSDTAAVEVRGVTQTSQGRTTLHEVSFSVAPGEVVAVVGGAGVSQAGPAPRGAIEDLGPWDRNAAVHECPD
jgi:ABC-type protease/lipase transport system fused ATPase/permease subunit